MIAIVEQLIKTQIGYFELNLSGYFAAEVAKKIDCFYTFMK